MTTSTLTVTDFVLARIAEDEGRARRASSSSWVPVANEAARVSVVAGWHVLDHSPARVLAQCAAMRKAIEEAWRDYMAVYNEYGRGLDRDELAALGDAPGVVKAFAPIWSDHPDFREEWSA